MFGDKDERAVGITLIIWWQKWEDFSDKVYKVVQKSDCFVANKAN